MTVKRRIPALNLWQKGELLTYNQKVTEAKRNGNKKA